MMTLIVLGLAAAAPPAAEAAALFRAAGFRQQRGAWTSECADMGGAYEPGQIAEYRDLDGDGRPEALITEGGTGCYGMTGMGYHLMSKTAAGGWTRILSGPGMVTVLPTRGAGGWPDLEIGGQGFCFPVMRWNGRAYAVQRHQYRGKPCRP